VREEPNSEHWEGACVLVSLDLIAPFSSGMGLQGLDTTRLREATRSFILTDPDRPTWEQDWLAGVAHAESTRARAHLERWIRYAYAPAPSTHAEWTAWYTLFQLVDTSPEGFRKLDLPADRIPALVDAYTTACDDEDRIALEEAARGADLTLWDLQMCASYGMMPDNEDDFLWARMRNTWRNHHFQTFFGTLMRSLAPEEQARLWQRGKLVRDNEDLVVPLVDPSSLCPATPWSQEAA
jgi:hypothetical protein